MTHKTPRRLVLFGAGKMGGALLKGWLETNIIEPRDIVVMDPQPSSEITALCAARGLALNPEQDGVPLAPEVVVLAVKPQIVDQVLPGLRALLGPETVCLSIAAGISLEHLAAQLGEHTPLVRAMPNLPASIGKGASAVVFGGHVGRIQKDLCTKLLESVGDVFELERESWMDAVTAVSGSGPAYVFLLIECLAAAGSAAGLPEYLAEKLALATVAGAGDLAGQSDLSPTDLRTNVTSPGGTTAAALEVLMGEGGLSPLLRKAVQAATTRSKELGGC